MERYLAILYEYNKRGSENYIKTAKFSIDHGKLIKNASIIRNNSDYDDFFIATKEQAEKQIEDAKKFLYAVKNYLENYFACP